ncbi:MAG: hypothetical protein LBF22_01795 [Deltaproteobacteria bacterium]|jgi:cell fate regulator YaaT (PSP1 superfamily)|nr:hypothetical protein [Deltaproteobacteria bacterium]
MSSNGSKDSETKGIPSKVRILDGQKKPPKKKEGPRLEFPARRTVNVRARMGGTIQAFDCGDLDLKLGDWVIFRTEDIIRMGVVTSRPAIFPADQNKRPVYLPSDRQLLRIATLDDFVNQAKLQVQEGEDFEYFMSVVTRHDLNLKLVAVEKALDNSKTIFYYTAEDRVDFRQLVKELVRGLRSRIEMRQISARHETLMMGGIGLCGRVLCCTSFLKNFLPVSVRMAKEQNMSINTSKISGVCGRLRCCLAFEGSLETQDEVLQNEEALETQKENLSEGASTVVADVADGADESVPTASNPEPVLLDDVKNVPESSVSAKENPLISENLEDSDSLGLDEDAQSLNPKSSIGSLSSPESKNKKNSPSLNNSKLLEPSKVTLKKKKSKVFLKQKSSLKKEKESFEKKDSVLQNIIGNSKEAQNLDAKSDKFNSNLKSLENDKIREIMDISQEEKELKIEKVGENIEETERKNIEEIEKEPDKK